MRRAYKYQPANQTLPGNSDAKRDRDQAPELLQDHRVSCILVTGSVREDGY